LNRPERLNAYGREMRGELKDAWERFRGDRDLRVAILTGEGRAFCVGRDIKEQAQYTGDFDAYTASFLGANRTAVTVLTPCDKPVVSAVNGFALGLGFFLMCLGDIRLASDTAEFGVPELPTGVLGPWYLTASELLPRAVASELILMGERISAQRAYELGLLNRVVPQTELMAAALSYAQRLAALPQEHLHATLRLMRRAHAQASEALWLDADEEIRALYRRQDTADAAAAFVNKQLR
jgi:enoyl-CoA hydratase/carnithine racemase